MLRRLSKGVLREIARHEGVEEIVICELDQGVIDASKKYLPGLAKGYDDPRVKVHVMDGAVFMAQNQNSPNGWPPRGRPREREREHQVA